MCSSSPLLPLVVHKAISEFCVYVGASSKLRGGLIKKAKTNGDNLGFLI
jgi:hypothetical protein